MITEMPGFKRQTAMRPAKLEYLSMMSKEENNPGLYSRNAMNKARNAYQANHVHNTYTRSQNYKNHMKQIKNMYEGGRRTRKARHTRKAKHTRKARHSRKH